MARPFPRVLLVLGLVLLAALRAGADVYHVKLKSGDIVDSRYQPQDASWDSHMVLLLTDVGNWIGVQKDDIESVTSENATRGFGVTIRNDTISLGVAPNDLPKPDEDKNQSPLDKLTAALAQGLGGQQQAAPYSIQQGVQTENTQGIPAAYSNPGGGGGSNTTTIISVPAPAPTSGGASAPPPQ